MIHNLLNELSINFLFKFKYNNKSHVISDNKFGISIRIRVSDRRESSSTEFSYVVQYTNPRLNKILHRSEFMNIALAG